MPEIPDATTLAQSLLVTLNDHFHAHTDLSFDDLAKMARNLATRVLATADKPDSVKRQRLAELEAEFDAAGGRGVELADEIDALRAELDGSVKLPDPLDAEQLREHLLSYHDTDAHSEDDDVLDAMHAEYHRNAETNGWESWNAHSHHDVDAATVEAKDMDDVVNVDIIVARIEEFISTSGLWDPHNSGYVFCVWDGHVNDNPVFKRQADYHPIIKVTWEGKRARLLPGDRDAIIAGLRATAGFRWDQAADAREVLLASGIDPDGKR